MTQEDKQLLLQDLCARLPYRVVYHRNDGANIKLKVIDVERGLLNYTDDIEEREVKLYLRPMSSMTEEERKWLQKLSFPYDFINCLNVHHFDYRGLIPKGLAIEVTKENNPYKTLKL